MVPLHSQRVRKKVGAAEKIISLKKNFIQVYYRSHNLES